MYHIFPFRFASIWLLLKCVDYLGNRQHQVALWVEGKLVVCAWCFFAWTTNLSLILAVADKPKWFWNHLRSTTAQLGLQVFQISVGASDMVDEQAQPAANMWP